MKQLLSWDPEDSKEGRPSHAGSMGNPVQTKQSTGKQDQSQERGSQAGCHGGSELVAEDRPKDRPKNGDAVLVGQDVLGHAVWGARWMQAFSEALMKGQREL